MTQVEDAGGGASYLMEFLRLERIVNSFPFKEKSVEYGLSNLLIGKDLIFDFDSHRLFLWEPAIKTSTIGQGLSYIKENYDSEIGRIYGDDPEDEKEWNHFIKNL
jgi:hypothetical protein